MSKLKYGGKTSVAGAIFITMNAIIGSAFLAQPYTTRIFNFEMLIFGQLPIVIISTIILCVLAKAMEISQKITFQDIVQVLFGPNVKRFIDLILLCYTFSTCVSYMMVVKDQSVTLIQWFVSFEDMPAHHIEWWNKIISTVTCLIMIYPLCLPRSVSFLYYPSIASFFANFYVLIFAIVYYFQMKNEEKPLKATEANYSFHGFVGFCAVVIFQYQSFYSAPAIYSDLKKRNDTNWFIVSFVSNFGSYVIYTVLAAFVLLTFGQSVDEDFLNSYDTKDPWAIVARVCIMTSVVSSYPVLSFVGCKVIQGALFPANQQQKTDESTNSNKATSSRLPFGKYFAIKTSFFILTLLCMLFAHGMTQVFVLSGILASFSTLGLPGLLMVRICKEYGAMQKVVWACGYFFMFVNALFIAGYLYTCIS